MLLTPLAAVSETHFAPPPNGVDDTAALQAALDICVPGSRHCKVKLAEGTYRTRQVYTYGFHGSLVGMGQEKTTIEPLPALDADPHFFENPAPPGPQRQCPCIVTFWSDADVRVSDLTFRVTDPYPTNGWYYNDVWVRWLKTMVLVSGSARIERVTFQAAPKPADDGTSFDRNADNGPMVFEASDVTVEIKRSHMRNLGNGYEIATLRRADVIIGGSEDDGNVFDQTSGAGLFYDLDSSSVDHSHNRSSSAVPDWIGIAIFHFDDFTYTGLTHYLVRENSLEIHGPPMFAIQQYDQFAPAAPTMDVTIVDNRIALDGDPNSLGIVLSRMAGGLVADNTLTGSGLVGIHAGRVAGCTIEDNRLRRFTASVAPIRLSRFSSGCTVRVSDLASVLDLGTGNTIIVAGND